MLSTLEGQVVNLKEFVRDMRVTFELVKGCTCEFDSMEEQFKDFVLESLGSNVEKMKRVPNSITSKLMGRDDALEAMMSNLKEEIAKLKRELTICKAALSNGMLALKPKQRAIYVPKLEKFKGVRSIRETENFLWEMKHYFRVMSIEDDVVKFQIKLKKQFYLQYARKEAQAKLRRLTQQDTVWEYVRTFSELMLQISNLSEKETFYWFEDGLKSWAKHELH
ncbi:hypothetical protein CXB51_016513 [Gossypium anomalum]|uniref:Retrotransposon gag domain-containing protein n=1 Tax=Gossypium anomalum TaxID=47600 RepID=A0A8J5ZHU4_9ROSI|nr:hypothetical protein CXB51_016513 [Gossypium anomalum]